MLRRALSSLIFASSLTLALPPAEAQVLRFSTTAPGTVVGIGNTLGLSKALNENGPGTRDSIGTFTTLLAIADDVPANALNPWPLGTTYDWTKNGSTAVLSLPSEGTVLYAELVWGGSYNYVDDVTMFLGTPVVLSAGNAMVTVPPDPLTAMTLAELSGQGFAVNYYMRSADVTAFVKSAGSGVYSVEGVPATQTTTINSLSAAGWTLAVAVRDPSSQIRNLSIFVGGSFVDENSQQDYTVSGFCAPPAGDVNGSIVVSTIEGDANLVGDQLLIAPTAAGPFVGLSGPNNPADNFFCSQINGANGLVDTQGTFGNVNHDAINGVNVSGGRQGWDVTTAPLSSQKGQLQNGQQSAVLRTITTGDSYVPIVAALAIDVNAPDFTGGGSKMMTSATHVTKGDQLSVALDLANTGQVVAESVKLTMPLDPGFGLVSFKMDGQVGDINGNPVSASALVAGVDAGKLGPGETRHVVIDLDVIGAPAGASFILESTWSYAYQVCAGGATLPETFGQLAVVTYDTSASSASSSSGSAGGAGGSSSSAGGGDAASGGAGGAGGGDPSESVADSGCGCSVPGDDGRSWAHAAIAIAALAAFARRRRNMAT